MSWRFCKMVTFTQNPTNMSDVHIFTDILLTSHLLVFRTPLCVRARPRDTHICTHHDVFPPTHVGPTLGWVAPSQLLMFRSGLDLHIYSRWVVDSIFTSTETTFHGWESHAASFSLHNYSWLVQGPITTTSIVYGHHWFHSYSTTQKGPQRKSICHKGGMSMVNSVNSCYRFANVLAQL